MHRHPSQLVRTPRRGTLLPAIAIAILTVGCCLALVLDRLWLDAARSELQTAAEAAALGAAVRLAGDERINPDAEPQLLTNAARDAAVECAAGNRCAGRPVLLDAEPGGALTFGQYALNYDNGLHEFQASEAFPTSVRCRLVQSRALGNPVARLFSGLSGEAGGDAVGQAEASLGNLIVGVRPFAGGPVPALPLAIWERDPSGQRTDTWYDQIERGAGGDNWMFDAAANRVLAGSDGLPEMVLTPMPPGGKSSDANFHMIDVGNGLHEDHLARQCRQGWNASDLADFGGALRLDESSQRLDCSAQVYDPTLEALTQMIGQKRIVLLYANHQPQQADLGQLTPTRFVAVRVMSVDAAGGQPRIIVQPTVLATRTALVIAGVLAPQEAESWTNPYIYKISLTN